MINTLFASNHVYTQSLTFNNPTLAGAPVFPNILSAPAGTPGTASIIFASPSLRTAYTQQIDVALEQALSKGTMLTVSYISRGKQLLVQRDLKARPLSNTIATYSILDTNLQTDRRVLLLVLFASWRLCVRKGLNSANRKRLPHAKALRRQEDRRKIAEIW